MGSTSGTSGPNGDKSAESARTQESATSTHTDESAVLSRRGLLRTAVPLGAAIVVGEALAPHNAEAAAGSALIMGQSNDSGTSQTSLKAATGSVAALNLTNSSTGSGQGTGLYALGGSSSGLPSSAAVIGDSHDLAGVEGTSNTNVGVSGKSENNHGVAGECDANSSALEVAGVYGSGQNYGVIGQGGSYGVFATGTSYGVFAESDTDGVYGSGVVYGVVASGDGAPLYLVPASSPGQPSSSTSHQHGEVYVDSTGVFWFCTASTSISPAVWGSVLLGGHGNSPVGQTSISAATGTIAALNVTNTSTSSGGGTGLYVLGGTSSTFVSQAAVIGDSHDLAGVRGTSFTNSGVSGVSSTSFGVQGNSSSGPGVYGFSPGGPGVFGDSTSGTGVIGTTSGNGQSAVHGADDSSGGGVGVLADSVNGRALQVNGVAAFSRSGLATVGGTSSSPLSSVTVTGVALTASSMVLATPQTHSGKVAVAAVVTHPATSSFTLYLTASVNVTFTVAWFVIG